MTRPRAVLVSEFAEAKAAREYREQERRREKADVIDRRPTHHVVEPGPGYTPDDEPHGIPLPWAQAWKPIPIWIVNVGLFLVGCVAVAIVLVAVMRQVWP